jgi:hypothetical protein
MRLDSCIEPCFCYDELEGRIDISDSHPMYRPRWESAGREAKAIGEYALLSSCVEKNLFVLRHLTGLARWYTVIQTLSSRPTGSDYCSSASDPRCPTPSQFQTLCGRRTVRRELRRSWKREVSGLQLKFGRHSTYCELTHTLPADNCLARRSARFTSLAQTDAPRPVFSAFARSTTSSSSDHFKRGTIGPNGSSWTIRESSGGLSMIAGVMKYPCSNSPALPDRAVFQLLLSISAYMSLTLSNLSLSAEHTSLVFITTYCILFCTGPTTTPSSVPAPVLILPFVNSTILSLNSS